MTPEWREEMTQQQQQPHPLRCETCEYWDKSQFPHKWGCNKIKRWMSYSQVDWVIRVGCASHSSAGKAEQRIKDVIAILQERHDDGIRLVMAQDVIALLRGKEE